MNKILLLAISLLLSTASFSAEKEYKCRKKYSKISCSEIKDAKRESFCWKGKITDKKKDKICKKAKNKKRLKR
jgi:hypothetical protein